MRDGETGEAVALEWPEGQTAVTFDVWLAVTPQFTVYPPYIQPVVLQRDVDRSSGAVFELNVDANAAAGDESAVTANFTYNGRPCGCVRREIALMGATATSTRPPSQPRPLVARVGERVPDLTIQVSRPADSPQRLDCWVRTPHLEQYQRGVLESWPLRDDPGQLVKGYMHDFERPQQSLAATTSALRGAGYALYNDTPENFKRVYWELVDADKPRDTILVVSDDQAFPWELVAPYRAQPRDFQLPLGVQYSVGRWIRDGQYSPDQDIALHDSFIVAPQYTGARKLEHATAEAAMVLGLFPGFSLTPVTFEQLNATLATHEPALLHFVCHGASGELQSIFLEDEQQLSWISFFGMQGAMHACGDGKPFVFINACEVGRPAPALLGAGGFAKACIDLGARCVIAPLWSVKDDIANKVASMFYDRINREPQTPFAEVLRDIRSLAYPDDGGEDTFAAYCLYGDPFAANADLN
jgi:hypothetical protein